MSGKALYRTTLMLFIFVFLSCSGSDEGNFNYDAEIEISPSQFRNLVRSMSEDGGYFKFDNWVSNEASYLHVLEGLEKHTVQGGAYIGVGPNQNFTYIEAVKPSIAFIVDIRAQNMLQHLVFKVLFEKAATRNEFFSLLFSKPFDSQIGPREDANINAIVEYFSFAPSSNDMLNTTVSHIVERLSGFYGFSLSEEEQGTIRKIMDTFYLENLNITYSSDRSYWFLSYAEFLKEKDQYGKQRNVFNDERAYQNLRDLHQKNLIIPLTGDFAGTKALASVSRYLTEKNIPVLAFYVSNVEQYLFRNLMNWYAFVKNVEMLPIDDKSVFIRWTYDGGYLSETKLQRIKDFLHDYQSGSYSSYRSLKKHDYLR